MFYSFKMQKFAEDIKTLQELDSKVNNHYNDLLLILDEKIKYIDERETEIKALISREENALKRIYEEKSKGFPWLSEAIAEYYKYIDLEIAKYLEKKANPAYTSADIVRKIANEKSILQKELRITKNFVKYYESLFPWLADYVGESLDELLQPTDDKDGLGDDEDPVLKFIHKSEYLSLSEEERNQKALDRYLSSKSTPWKIGRDYERYIGYLYEQDGFIVEYTGIEEGLEDLGRDLVCVKNNQIEIVQCKCWSSHKLIHEKHINQLFGTTVKYCIDHCEHKKPQKEVNLFSEPLIFDKISATLVTSTKLSETAKKFATALGIKFREELLLAKYPIIKCNISSKGEKIYHLPFDQQYDKTVISKKGEFYALTIKEAVDNGFRRAHRWSGK